MAEWRKAWDRSARRWRVIPRLILARVRWAWRGWIIGSPHQLGLKTCRPDGNARDRRTQIRNLVMRPRVGIGKVVGRHVRVHV